jgi:hypothetical protein
MIKLSTAIAILTFLSLPYFGSAQYAHGVQEELLV